MKPVPTITRDDIAVKIMLNGWDTQYKRTTQLLDKLTDDQLQADVSPGRNSGYYVLGHLIAVHDHLFPLLGIGERLHPELDAIYISTPDKQSPDGPTLADLRAYWTTMGQKLAEAFATLDTVAWFGPHTTISAEDFAREPHRNRLNVILFRTTHLAYHLGQLVLLGGQD
jgi:DinB superfamily